MTSGVAALVIVGLVWFAHMHPSRSEDVQNTQWNGMIRLIVLAAATALLVGVGRVTREKSAHIMASVILLVFALDGLTHSPKVTPLLPAGVLESGLLKFNPSPGLNGNRAMLIRPAHDEIYATMLSDPLKDFILHRQALFGNCNLIDHVPTTDGFFSLYVKEQRQVWSHLWFQQTNWAVSPLLDFLSVAHINTETIFDWTNRASALPVASIGQAPVFADVPATLQGLISSSFDPKQTVFLPESARGLVRATRPVEAKILASEFSAHRIALKVSATADTLLVLAQSHYGPWRVFVDKNPAPLLRANHAFQAVPVSSGNHDIVIEYHDVAFRTGAAITVCVLVLVALLWVSRVRWV